MILEIKKPNWKIYTYEYPKEYFNNKMKIRRKLKQLQQIWKIRKNLFLEEK